MNKKLNIEFIKKRIEEYGLSQTRVSEKIGVKRQTVSLWMNNKNLPKADNLLKLGLLLNARYDQIIIKKEDPYRPQVAFRLIAKELDTWKPDKVKETVLRRKK